MKKCLKWIIISAVLAGAGYGIYVWTSSGEKDDTITFAGKSSIAGLVDMGNGNNTISISNSTLTILGAYDDG